MRKQREISYSSQAEAYWYVFLDGRKIGTMRKSYDSDVCFIDLNHPYRLTEHYRNVALAQKNVTETVMKYHMGIFTRLRNWIKG